MARPWPAHDPPTTPGRAPGFDDRSWQPPATVSVGSGLTPPVPLAAVTGPASSKPGPVDQIGSGTLVERYGYVNDDPAARFILREY